MVLGKFFKKNKSPQNDGKADGEVPTKLITKYYLNAKSLKGKPIFELTGNHIVGSVDADILIEDKTVSDRHLELVLDDGVVTIKDLGSEHGTFLGKKQIEADKKVILRDGDTLKIGKVKVIFEEIEEEVPDLSAESNEPSPELSAESNEPSPELSAESNEPSPDIKESSNEDGAELSLEDTGAELSLDDNASAELSLEESEEEAVDLSENEPVSDSKEEQKEKTQTKAEKKGLKVSQEDLDSVELKDRTEKTFKLQLYDYDKPDPDQIYKYDEEELDEGDKTLTRKIMRALNVSDAKKKVKVKAKKGVVTPAANAIVRFLGLIFDLVLFSLLISIIPAQKQVLKYIDIGITKSLDFITPLFKKYALQYVDMAYKEVPALAKIQAEVVQGYKDEYYEYILLFFLFIAFQILLSFLFGITLGQFFFGMKAKGNFILKRLLAPIRVILNYLFLPFFILFELPTLFSKRSFKEVITFTHIEMVSKARVFLTLFLLIPLMGLGFIVSPLFKDFTVPKPIKVIANSEFKLQKLDENPSNGSKSIGLLYENESARFFPMIKTIQSEGKMITQLGARIIINSDILTAKIEVIQNKSINLSKFFKQYTKLNPYVYFKYPTLLSIVNDASVNNPNFKDTKFPKDKIAKELQEILEGAFSFDINQFDKMQAFMINYGPFFTGHMHMRERIMSLVEHPIKEFSIKQNGQSFALHINTEVGNNKFLYIMPINSIKTNVYKVNYENKDLLPEVEKIILNSMADITDYEGLKFLLPYSNLKNKKEFNNDELFQASYKFLFDSAKLYLEGENAKALALLQESIREMIQLLEMNEQSEKLNQDIVDKMIQNLNDLLQSIVEKNHNFFGITKTKTV